MHLKTRGEHTFAYYLTHPDATHEVGDQVYITTAIARDVRAVIVTIFQETDVNGNPLDVPRYKLQSEMGRCFNAAIDTFDVNYSAEVRS